MFRKLLNKFYKSKYHRHNMIVEQYTEETCMGKKKHSRLICKKCGWVNYDSWYTNVKKPF